MPGSLEVKYLRKQHLWKGGIQPLFEPLVEANASNFPISKSMDTVPITPISMASSLSQSEDSIHVSFIRFTGL